MLVKSNINQYKNNIHNFHVRLNSRLRFNGFLLNFRQRNKWAWKALNLSNENKLCKEARLSQKFRKALRERRESLILYWVKDWPVRNICVDKQISIINFALKICMKFSRSHSVRYRLTENSHLYKKVIFINNVILKSSNIFISRTAN